MRQLRSPDVARMVHGEEGEAKHACRERVAEFLLNYQPTDRCRLFTMPGVRWQFEELVLQQRRDTRFVAVERNWSILEAGQYWMPGLRRFRMRYRVPGGELFGIESESASVIHAELSTLMRAVSARDNRPEQRRWRESMRQWTGAWLDFQSSLCTEVNLCLPRIQSHCDTSLPVVPVAVTVMKAREPRVVGNAIELLGKGREGFVASMVGSCHHGWFETVDSFEYASDGGTPMLTVMGLLHNPEAAQ